MKVIRYAISKRDLHELLKSLGILRKNERLLSVSNIDLIDDSQEMIVVTVSDDAMTYRPIIDVGSLTDKELNERFTQLSILDNLLREEMQRIANEMTQIVKERNKRSSDTDVTSDGIPSEIDMRIANQIRKILSGNRGKSGKTKS